MNRPKLVCLGDSLTEGFGINQTTRWSTLLQKEFDIEIINQGISGDTTGGMLARFQNDVVLQCPTHLIITGGTNDLAWNLPDELILSNYSAMFRHALRSDIQTIIGIPTPVFYDDYEISGFELYINLGTLSDRVKELRRKLKLFAAHKNLPIIDFFKNITPELFLPDGVHPNEKGNAVMKETASEALRKIFHS